MFESENVKPRYTLIYPKKLGITKQQVLRERNKLHNPDVWDFEERSTSYVLKFNKQKAKRKLQAGTFRSAHHPNGRNHDILDMGEPKGFYFGKKEKRQSGFGQIDYDFGLRL